MGMRRVRGSLVNPSIKEQHGLDIDQLTSG